MKSSKAGAKRPELKSLASGVSARQDVQDVQLLNVEGEEGSVQDGLGVADLGGLHPHVDSASLSIIPLSQG